MVYKEKYLKILSEAVDFIKCCDAGFRTTQGFGRRWLKNFFKNLKLVSHVLLYRPLDMSIIITGSGPGLEKTLPRIHEINSQVLIIAASSSVLALKHRGINPNIIINTDGGSWALCHLHACLREAGPFQGLAVNLCAALPSQCKQYPFLILNEGSLWQTLVLSGLGIPSVIVGQRGTVSASALELALELGRGPVYMAGLDLCVNDIRTHARPYGLDYLLYSSANRFKPLYSQFYKRANGISGGKSLEIYAAWFRDKLKHLPDRIYSLDAHNTVFRNVQADSFSDQEPGSKNNFSALDFFKTQTVSGNPRQFCMQAIDILFKALDDPRYETELKTELIELLFPGKKNTCASEIQKELKTIAKKYSGNHG